MSRPLPSATESENQAGADRWPLWHRRVLGFCLVIFALEIGIFLLIFPWTHWWERNWLPINVVDWADLWMSPYIRGAVSGLGILNVYVAIAELFHQVRSLLKSR